MRFLLLFAVLILFTCCESQRNCTDFKSGKFYSEVEIDGVVYKSVFERNESLQVEFYNQKTDSSRLRWINDCEVIFRTINPKNMAEKKDVHLKIITTTDSSYTYEYSYVGETKKQKGIAYKTN
ncbi:DNA topoisomerase IV [Flavisericum labens]|uniref:DNA topoisomerase IV n=1 Tax=Flavisericum labens TaxID=3377112 RepID=UPI00387A8B61